jgi:parallel beta-helix repeat protein
MPITHAATKIPGQTGTADEWNADHVVSSGFAPRQSATLVIAAVDSQSTERADYVCDGVADEVQINLAVTDLNGVGGRIILLEGNYAIAASIVLDDDITLEGQGFYSIINATTEITMIAATNKSRILIKNLKLHGAGGSLQYHHGIVITGGEGCGIINCWVENVSSHQIEMQSHTEGRVINCISIDSTMLVTGWGIYMGASNSMLVLGNVVTGNRSKGIRFVTTTLSVIKNNVVRNNGLYGIELSFNSDDNIISDNVSEGHTANGVRLRNDCNSNIISSNRAKNNASSEIVIEHADCDNNLVHGNHCLGTHAFAIQDNGTNTTLADNVVA